jgi:hypothetical protein
MVSVEDLLRRDGAESGFPEDDVEIPGVGTVRVRGLSRAEVLRFQAKTQNPAYAERMAIAAGMIDPVMTEDQVAKWQRVSVAGAIGLVSDRIAELSGMAGRPDKAAYKSDGGESDAGVRVLSGGEVEDDSGADAPESE